MPLTAHVHVSGDVESCKAVLVYQTEGTHER